MAASILYGVATYFYYEKVRRTMRTAIVSNLIKDTCSKILFTSNKKLYQQIDLVSMSSSLGPLLPNIIMTE